MSKQESKRQIGGVNIEGSGTIQIEGGINAQVTAGRDIVAGNVVAGPAPGTPQAELVDALKQWKAQVEIHIAALDDLDEEEKQELAEKADKVESEASKGPDVNPGKLERLLNSMSSMAPDILEVTVTTLLDPFAGVGLVLKKINDRIKVTQQAQADAGAKG